MQVSGFISSSDGRKRIALSGKWNSHLDMQKCDEEGELMPGSDAVRMWTVSPPCYATTHPDLLFPLLSAHNSREQPANSFRWLLLALDSPLSSFWGLK